MIIIKTLKITNKDLDTSPIRSLVRTGENNADTIVIEADRFYNGYDLSQFCFIMEGRNALDTLSVQTLEMEQSQDKIRLLFNVSADFTGVSGILKLTLKAVDANDEVCIIFNGGEVCVTGNTNDDCLPADIGEQLLSEIEKAIASLETEAKKIVSEQVNEEIKKQLPENFVESSTVKEITALTQEEYDSISTPDDNVMYLII